MSKRPWKRDASGRPLEYALPENVLSDDGTPHIDGCPNPLTVTSSIGHAVSLKAEGCSPNEYNSRRLLKEMEGHGYPFVRIDGILVTDQSSAVAWGKNRSQLDKRRKPKTDPSSGSSL